MVESIKAKGAIFDFCHHFPPHMYSRHCKKYHGNFPPAVPKENFKILYDIIFFHQLTVISKRYREETYFHHASVPKDISHHGNYKIQVWL